MLIIFTVLILSVILVNGTTDAPNAISTCVSTRSMSPKGALILAAVCNLLGSIVMTLISSKVAGTVYGMVDLSSSPENALASICAGLFSVVVWALIALKFGIPTSESHALLAGLTGAAVASSMSLDVISASHWLLVIFGLFLSTLPAFLLARIVYSVMIRFLSGRDRRRTIKYFMRAQRISAAWSAFLHGAQDSQKFMGVFMLGLSITRGNFSEELFEIPIHIVLCCSLVMTLGTLIGGSRIIKKVGLEMVDLDAAGGTAADMASSAVLLLCSICGIPVSTTHSKSCAMMGVGSKRRGTDKKIVSEMLVAWILTFPICAAIGFCLSYLITQTL